MKLFIPVILGTNREGRHSENVANLVYGVLDSREGIDTKLIDVKDHVISNDDYGQSTKDQVSEYRDAILQADGLVIVSPEYNRSYPGTLKTLLDTLLPEYNHKAVGLVGVSAGPWGGTRVIESLLGVVRELGLVATSVDLNFPKVGSAFNDNRSLVDETYRKRADGFVDELAWMSASLKMGRESMPDGFKS